MARDSSHHPAHARESESRGLWLAGGIAALAACVYASLTSPVSGMGDSSEFTLVLATGGVAHPTGYPIYTLTGHLFGLACHVLGVGWPRAAALWSAVGGATALFFAAALAHQWVSRVPGVTPRSRALAVLAPLLAFAFQPVVLDEATRAEVNSWSLAWTCGLVFGFANLERAGGRTDAGGRAGRDRAAALWGALCGLGLAHHATSVLVSVPLSAVLAVIQARRGTLAIRDLGIAAGAASVPLAADLIIAWRAWHPARVQWPMLEPDLSSVVDHLTARQYRHYIGGFAPSATQRALLASAVYPFLLPGFGFLGLALARARDTAQRLAAAGVLIAALAGVVFGFGYGVVDPAPYFLAPMALGVAAAAPALATLTRANARAGMVVLVIGGVASLACAVPWVRDGIERRTATIDFDRVIRSMWSSIPADTAIVSWDDDRFMRLIEYQILGGEKPALLIVNPDVLLARSVRHQVIDRFGADPLEGFRPPRRSSRAGPDAPALEAARRDLLRRLNDRVRVPVILFDPTVPIVWRYRKPWEPRAPDSRTPDAAPAPRSARRP